MRILITLFLINLALPSSAQVYQLINNNMDRLYKHDGEIFGMRIDSIEPGTPLSGDTLYHGFYQVAEYGDCITPYGPFWLGDPIQKKENGDFVFHNFYGKSITIKNQSHTNIGDQWNCFTTGNLQNVLTIKATVDTALLFDFLGLTDSVKVIRFQAYDENGDETECPVNGTKIKISKHYGLIQTLPFVVFPNVENYSYSYPNSDDILYVVGMANPDTGISNLTRLEVFDYYPGDEIHIKTDHFYWNGSGTQTLLEDKILRCLQRFEFEDSLKYTMERQWWYKKEVNYNDTPEDDTIIEFTRFDTVQKSYTPSERFDSYPKESYVNHYSDDHNFVYQNSMDSLFLGSSKRLNRTVGTFLDDDTCMSIPSFDGCSVYEEGDFYKGLGGPYYYCTNFGSYDYKRELVYYKKGDQEWGNPINIFPTDNKNPATTNKDAYRIYPNPADDYFIVEMPGSMKKNIKMLIFDNFGRKIFSCFPEGKRERINHSLSPGIYIYHFTKGSKTLQTGKLVVN